MKIKSIIPNTVNTSPDYYCTWQTQLYYCNDGGPVAQRRNITEQNLFGDKAYQGWAYMHPEARRDLHIVLDDSWDVPVDGHDGTPDGYKQYYGSLVLDKGKFPGCAVDNPAESLKRLNQRITDSGWRSCGGWVCVQESALFMGKKTPEEYWKERMMWADYAGIGYYKADWGSKAGSLETRRLLTELSHKHAKNLTVEQAMIKEIIPYCDSYRTYDVPAIMSIPMTFAKLREFLPFTAQKGYGGIVNCEDEVYVAAVLGCGMGVMRHSFVGALPDGRPDPSFPETGLHRNLKTKMSEVVRAARWHRVAPAFAVNAQETHFSGNNLTDNWAIAKQCEEIEAWWKFVDGDVIEKSGVASISRGCALPDVTPDKNGNIPFAAASLNPNGVFSVGTFGRTLGRSYSIPLCHISVNAGSADTIGIFGRYAKLTLYSELAKHENIRVFAQDIALDEPEEITEAVFTSNGTITIPGEIIDRIGTLHNPCGDTSEPGMAIKIVADCQGFDFGILSHF